MAKNMHFIFNIIKQVIVLDFKFYMILIFSTCNIYKQKLLYIQYILLTLIERNLQTFNLALIKSAHFELNSTKTR